MFFTVKIALEDPLLSGFHRRGRRKLREMEEDVPPLGSNKTGADFVVVEFVGSWMARSGIW